MIEHPPHPRLGLEQRAQQEEGLDGIVRGLERAAHVHGHLGARAGMQQHDVVPVVAGEEEGLAHDALVGAREGAQAGGVPGAEDVREGAVDGAEVGEQLRLVPRGRADGQVERARRADALLHQVRERPAAADVGRVGGRGVGCRGGVVDQVVHVHVGVGGGGGQGEEDGEEGVL